MRTTFSGISIALRALQAQQASLDVTAHNVANANTPGFSRQSAVLSSSRAYPVPMLSSSVSNGQYGTGVQISQVVRMRDLFVETRLRQENPQLGYWETLREGLTQVELFFNEPGETGIASAMDQLWDSLQDLSHSADSMAARQVVVQRAQVFVEAVQNTRRQLQSLREDLNNRVGVLVEKINTLARQIADLNNQIGKVTASGNLPNDLMDQRDLLLEELSRIAEIDVTDDHANMVLVTLDGVSLVQRSTAYELEVYREHDFNAGYGRIKVRWQSTGIDTDVRAGELGATLHLRDEDVQYYINKLDTWTADFAEAFNARHKEGYRLDGEPGEDFFTFVSEDGSVFPAMHIRVNPDIEEDPGRIAAAYVESGQYEQGQVANGENALRLSELRYRWTDEFIAIVSQLGVESEKAKKMAENRDVLVNHLHNLREATSGVNLDEEMANMIKFQHAYNAAARLMTAVDETLDVIINRLGVVGR
ncbi:MAG: flagellar hook-associated protein FlgK [Limnochordia bacterium]|jgi:flagellar hook-associated protein 1 FlgK